MSVEDALVPVFAQLVQILRRVQAELFAAVSGNHALVPWRIPNEMDVRFLDGIQRQQTGLDVSCDLPAEMATRGSERHFHVHFAAVERHVVNQTEIDDVQRDFGVEALTQFIPNALFAQTRGRSVRW